MGVRFPIKFNTTGFKFPLAVLLQASFMFNVKLLINRIKIPVASIITTLRHERSTINQTNAIIRRYIVTTITIKMASMIYRF